MIHKVFFILWKDLLMRRNHYFATALEVVLPIGLLILTNLSLPKFEPEVDNDSMSFQVFKDKQCFQRHSHYGNIVYEPSTPFIDMLMSKAACYAGYMKSSVTPGNLNNNNSYFSIWVKFENVLKNDTEIPSFLNYTLFPTNKALLDLKNLWRHFGTPTPRFSIPSLYSIVELQRGIDISFLFLKNISMPELVLENTDVFGRGPRLFSIAVYFAIYVAFSLMVPPIVSRIVQEKFTGSKELMLMMGVTRWQLWVAKFMDVILFMLITVSGMVLFLCVPLKEESNHLKIPPLLFWGVIMYGLCSVILFLFFLTCFFEKSTVAVYITQIIWVFSFILKYVISNLIQLPLFAKYLLCLLPHVCLMEGVSILMEYDFYEKTIKLTEMIGGSDNSLTLLSVLTMIAINIFIYGTLTWYLEQVKPGKYGVPQPYNFCFKKNYWFPRKVLNSFHDNSLNETRNNFEPVPSDLRVGVSLQNVSKVFKSLDKGTVTAVDDVSLDFYHSEISALLGHNGAGKTTVFSMITGLSYPTSGRIIINGYDLSVNVREARRSLGLCPQQDMLFNNLTAIQIMRFYGVMKGLTFKEAKAEANDLIKKLKLTNVSNTQAARLSGGQKRKVSLAIALIGGSEVLVLDEPTAGMDPEIRREIWEILLGFRGSRTILLTTHFMEEADALCDRIAIMDHGKIKCCGSPMYLKSKFGKGYILNVVVRDLDNAKELAEYVKECTPSAKFKSQNIKTLVFEVPESEVSAFPTLLSGLEEKQEKNEVASYCICLCTLEDVFLRLRSGHEEKDDFDLVDSPPFKVIDITNENKWETPQYFLYLLQFWALTIKKWIYFKRTYKSFLMYSILPALLITLMTFLSDNKQSKNVANPIGRAPLTYSLCLYPSSLVLHSHDNDPARKQLFSDIVRGCGSEAREVNDIKNATREIFEDDFYTYARKLILGLDFAGEAIRIHHNEEAVHMVPVSLNFIHNLVLKYWRKNESIVTSLSVKYANKDVFLFPRSISKCSSENIPDFGGFQTMFYLLVPVKERFFGSKGLQLMMTTATLYWLSHLVFDVISFYPYILLVSTGVGFSRPEEFQFLLENPGGYVLGFLFWGAGLILITYVISTFMKNAAGAFSVNIAVYGVCSFVIYNFVSLKGLPEFLQYLHPSCILKFGLQDLCIGKKTNFIWALILYNCCLFAFLVIKDSRLLGRLIHGLLNRHFHVNYSLPDGFISKEYSKETFSKRLPKTVTELRGTVLPKRCCPSDNCRIPEVCSHDREPQEKKDEYVKEEEDMVRKLINKENLSGAALIVSDLKRWYLKGFRPSPAVRGISFSVNKGECFGLLGVNGAGKTSSFRILTGGLTASHGSSYACSEQLSLFNKQKYLFSIGYCPQFGGLIPAFKGKEVLEFFARLRGISGSCVEEEVQKWLEKMKLLEYAKQKCGTYSGGNQRKLSTAIALIGDRPLIFLDEPTTGVDPLSRRSIWNVIGDIQKEGQSVVLTSHSMDECEALCSRLAIMVNGRFRCIGEVTTLKDRFGQGYCVQLKLSNGTDEEVVHSIKAAVMAAFEPGCELVDEHLTVLQYHLTNKSVTWANLFNQLNILKEKFRALESYTASATTLEQIFIYFARNTGESVREV